MLEKIEEFNWVVTKEQSKKHVVDTFEVKKAYKKLIFSCSYSPKYLEDQQECLKLMREAIEKAGLEQTDFSDIDLIERVPLANHISWSIDSPKEWIGTKHKHNPNQILTISPEKSTFGFFNTPIYEGQWRITASLNAILTDEVEIHVLVEGEREDEMD